MNPKTAATLAALILVTAFGRPGRANEAIPMASSRFADLDATETPDFQRHVLPLMGRLGCNGRACHGSFQGQGGLRLSLFGYDFETDHDALLDDGEGRVVVDDPDLSLILEKPTLTRPHKGGKILEYDSWQYNLIRRWIESGADSAAQESTFDRLELIPSEVVFDAEGQEIPLRAVAHWSDGTAEDVTCLTRFQTNDDSIAEVDAEGIVRSVGVGDTYVIALYDNGVVGAQVLRPVATPIASGSRAPEAGATEIDRLIGAKLDTLGIVPSDVCDDSEFLRRVGLDLTGTLPTPEEIRAFDADNDPAKRSKKVDELLERSTYAAWWTNMLCDITGASPSNLRGVANGEAMARHWYDWIYSRVEANVPYDELIAGIVMGTSREPGQDYEDFLEGTAALYREDDPEAFDDRSTMPYFWARRNVRKPEEKALAFSYAFLGVRLECAQCHKHPFDQWTQDDFNQFTAFFQPVTYGFDPRERPRIKELERELGLEGKPGGVKQREIAKTLASGEIAPIQEVFVSQGRLRAARQGSSSKSRGGRVFTPRVLGGDEVALKGIEDPRAPVMAWLRDPENPYFARALVNRVWANHFGRGIIDPPDDMNLANPPSNPALLDYLAVEFVAHGFDLKWLQREITASLAYQRSWRPNETNRLDDRNFSRADVRRLPAEALLDAVAQATADPEVLAKFAVNVDDRWFGPVKGIGGRNGPGYAERVFGRSTRDTNCDCSRSDEPNLLQAIFLQNDREVHLAIDRRDGWVRSIDVSGSARAPGDLDRIDSQVERGQRALAALRRRGAEQSDAALKIRRRLEAMRKQRTATQKRARIASSSTPFDADAAIEEAFLRTLSRLPDASERAASADYFDDAEAPADGLRGLLWALLNTKEFMTNH